MNVKVIHEVLREEIKLNNFKEKLRRHSCQFLSKFNLFPHNRVHCNNEHSEEVLQDIVVGIEML